MVNQDKMLSGRIYDPNEPALLKKRQRAHELCRQYNLTSETDTEEREKILHELLPHADKSVLLQGPVFFDYGEFTSIGEGSFANFNLTVLDVCPVTIGKNVYIGPNVSILTPLHPLCYQDRNAFFDKAKGYVTDKEYGAQVKIDDDCWIAGNVTILPGVTIGSGSVIGAGSVVNKSVPKNSLAFGNPCHVRRKITKEDRLALKKEIL